MRCETIVDLSISRSQATLSEQQLNQFGELEEQFKATAGESPFKATAFVSILFLNTEFRMLELELEINFIFCLI